LISAVTFSACFFACACGGRAITTEDASAASPFCRKWPDDRFLCDGPLLSGEDAYARLEQSERSKDGTLVALNNGPAAGLTPDGDQSLQVGGWVFSLLRVDGSLERIDVDANSVRLEESHQVSVDCRGERIVPDGLAAQVSTAVELVEQTYGASFVPGTFAINLRREAACVSISALARTIIEFQLDRSTVRGPTVEFDGTGALVGACDVSGPLLGCRG
jgi:hypothetical protein